MTIAGSSYVGRQSLARQSGLGEGAIRTILKKLKEEGYVAITRSGCYLTHSGRQMDRAIHSSMSAFALVPGSDLTMGEKQVALVIRGAGGRVRSGIEQRDSAIRTGASGATTYVMRVGRFTVPGGSSDCERDFPSGTWPRLRSELRPKNGDAVILCGAKDDVLAKLGVLSAAITLL